MGKLRATGENENLSESGFRLNKNDKIQTIFVTAFIFLASFWLSFVCGSLSLIPRSVNAEESASGDDNLSLTVGDSETNVLVGSPDGESVSSGEINLTASTGVPTGYTLKMSSSTEDADLKNSDGINKITNTENTSAAPLSANTWGYNLESSQANFIKIPSPTSPDTIKYSSSPITDDETVVTLGAKVGFEVPAGGYSNVLSFTVVANYVPVSITSVSPDSGVWEGDTITING